jgi:hypothetical protein
MMDGDVVLFNRFDQLIAYEAGGHQRDGQGCRPVQPVVNRMLITATDYGRIQKGSKEGKLRYRGDVVLLNIL